MKKIIVFGNSDFAELATYYLQKQYEIEAYCVDKDFIKESCFLSKPVVPFEEIVHFYPPEKFNLFVAVGYHKRNTIRQEKIEMANDYGYKFVNYIHPSAIIDNSAKIGYNCLILENSVIQPFVVLGNGSIMWVNSTLCHHSIVGDYCFIASNVCINGYVTIKDNCFIGAGVIIRDKITINKNNLIGAGCTIQSDTDEGAVYKNNSAVKIN